MFNVFDLMLLPLQFWAQMIPAQPKRLSADIIVITEDRRLRRRNKLLRRQRLGY